MDIKQPELGKKISEMRKAKGLTQEELVEMCNLNVRTIQRIEAGEVTPRSYTVKTLFEALGIRGEREGSDSEQSFAIPKFLYLALAGGILYFFASIFEIVMEGEYVSGDYSFRIIGFIIAKTLSFGGYVLFGLGWIKLGSLLSNQLLKISFWIMLAACGIWYFADLIALNSSAFAMTDYYLVKISSFGFGYILLGMGFLAFKKQFSSMGTVIGALTIISGVFIFSGIGAILGLVVLTLAELGQIGLMIYLIQKSGRSISPELSF